MKFKELIFFLVFVQFSSFFSSSPSASSKSFVASGYSTPSIIGLWYFSTSYGV